MQLKIGILRDLDSANIRLTSTETKVFQALLSHEFTAAQKLMVAADCASSAVSTGMNKLRERGWVVWDKRKKQILWKLCPERLTIPADRPTLVHKRTSRTLPDPYEAIMAGITATRANLDIIEAQAKLLRCNSGNTAELKEKMAAALAALG